MSKASIRRNERSCRRLHRRRSTVHRSKRGFALLCATGSFKVVGLRFKLYDIDEVVDLCIRERRTSYSPARDSNKKMCSKLLICQGEMGSFLLEVANRLKPYKWLFHFDDTLIDAAGSLTVADLKAEIHGKTE